MHKNRTLRSDSFLTVFEHDNSWKLLQLYLRTKGKYASDVTVIILLPNHIETSFAITLIPLVILTITVRKLMYSNSNSRLQMVTYLQ